MKTPSISRYPTIKEISSQIYQVETGETWMTPYKHYLANGILPLELTEAKKIKEKFGQVHPH